MDTAANGRAWSRVASRAGLVVLVALLCMVQGVSQPAWPAPGVDPAADVEFLRLTGILDGFSDSWVSQDGPVSKEEAVVLGVRLHAYVLLRIAEQNMSEPLDRKMNRFYALRKATAKELWGIPVTHWAYPAAMYLSWVDEVAPGRAEEVLRLAGQSRFEFYATLRSTIERTRKAYDEARADEVMQWTVETEEK